MLQPVSCTDLSHSHVVAAGSQQPMSSLAIRENPDLVNGLTSHLSPLTSHPSPLTPHLSSLTSHLSMPDPRRFRAELAKTLALACPIMAGQVGQMLMGLVDTLMVGHVGTSSL